MLTEYIRAALRRAHYELLDDGTFCAGIPGLPGVLATAATLEACREELREVLEGWIVLGLRLGHLYQRSMASHWTLNWGLRNVPFGPDQAPRPDPRAA